MHKFVYILTYHLVSICGLNAISSASFAQECDDACDLILLQEAPKVQREILKQPKDVEEEVHALEKAALDRKKGIEEQIQKLKDIEDDLDNFMAELSRNKKDFDRQSAAPNLHPKDKKDLVDDFQDAHRALEKNLKKIRADVNKIISSTEETPFLKRRLQEAEQKLEEFALSLNSGRDSADKIENLLKKNEMDRISLMEEVLQIEDVAENLEPISVILAAATAQSLKTMVGTTALPGISYVNYIVIMLHELIFIIID